MGTPIARWWWHRPEDKSGARGDPLGFGGPTWPLMVAILASRCSLLSLFSNCSQPPYYAYLGSLCPFCCLPLRELRGRTEEVLLVESLDHSKPRSILGHHPARMWPPPLLAWRHNKTQSGSASPWLREMGQLVILFSSPLHSLTILCRTLPCCGRKPKPGAWPSLPERGEHFRSCFWWEGTHLGRAQPSTQEAHT